MRPWVAVDAAGNGPSLRDALRVLDNPARVLCVDPSSRAVIDLNVQPPKIRQWATWCIERAARVVPATADALDHTRKNLNMVSDAGVVRQALITADFCASCTADYRPDPKSDWKKASADEIAAQDAELERVLR